MEPIAWLCAREPGFCALPEVERQAIMGFSLLWSLFEAEALDTNASSKAIQILVGKWDSQGKLDSSIFGDHIAYLRSRYFANGSFTDRFGALHLSAKDLPMVKAVLRGKAHDAKSEAIVVLTIVYRFRNNLFHGIKWAYDLNGQFENFSHANAILIKALELTGGKSGSFNRPPETNKKGQRG